MTRLTEFPAQTIRERIRVVEHYPPYGPTHGIVKVTIGVVNADGAFIEGRQRSVMIEGRAYTLLIGPPQPWCPDKPVGTWRTEDLWPLIDELNKTADNS